jgi:hypothetical protein
MAANEVADGSKLALPRGEPPRSGRVGDDHSARSDRASQETAASRSGVAGERTGVAVLRLLLPEQPVV